MPKNREYAKLDKDKIFEMFSFFKWYIWILIIGLVLGSWIYLTVSKDLTKTVRNNKADVVAHNSMIMDLKLSTTNELIYRYNKSVPIMQYAKTTGMNNTHEISNAMKARDSIRDESTYIQDNNESIILDSFVFYNKSGVIISKNIIEDLTELLSSYLIYPDVYREELLSVVKNQQQIRAYIEATPINYYGVTKEVITYTHQIDNKKGEEIYAVILLDVEKIYQYTAATLTNKGYYSMGAKDQPIITLQKNDTSLKGYDLAKQAELKDRGKGYIQLEGNSELLNIKHTMLEPVDTIKGALSDVRRIFIITLTIYLLAGGGIVILFAWSNYKELAGVFEALKGSSIKEVKNNAKIIIRKNLELTTQNKIRSEAIRNNIYKNLLIGHITEKDEFLKKLQTIGQEALMLDQPYIQVAYIIFNGDKEEVRNRIVKNNINKYIKLIEQVEWEKNKLVYIFGYDNIEAYKEVAVFLENIELQLSEIPQEINIGLGKVYSDIEELHQSYAEAKCVAQLRIGQKEYPLLYNELITKEEGLYYPQEIEEKLINGVLNGDKENVESLLEFINEENIIKRKLMGDLIKHLKYQQIGTIPKILAKTSNIDQSIELEVQSRTKRMINNLNYKEYIDIKEEIDISLKACYMMVLESIENSKAEQADKVNHEIMDYIRKNIINPDLDMNSLVDHFSVSRGYLSKVIKEQANKNFSNYVEDYRMEMANEMIKKTDIPIYVISENVGYYSSGTFGRAYKRKYGISPTQLREEYREQA